MKILGVAFREEFTLNHKIQNAVLEYHPHHVGMEEMLRLIRHYKSKWNCTHIFVSTQFNNMIEELKREFEEDLICTNRKRVDIERWICARKKISTEGKFRYQDYEWLMKKDEDYQVWNTYARDTMVEYVEEIYGLSLCNCLLTGRSSGAIGGCIWNGGKYEQLKIIENVIE